MFVKIKVYDDELDDFYLAVYSPCLIERVKNSHILLTSCNSSVPDILVLDVPLSVYDTLLRYAMVGSSFNLELYHSYPVTSYEMLQSICEGDF